MDIIGQIIGFIAIGVASIIFLFNKRGHILILKLLTDVLWALHHILLGNLTAGVTTAISIFREILFIKKRYAVFLIIFPVLYFGTLFFTFKNITSLIPPVASTIATVAFWNKNVKYIKLFSVAVSVLMLVYAVCNGSIATIVNELLVIATIFISLIRPKIKKCESKIHEKTDVGLETKAK